MPKALIDQLPSYMGEMQKEDDPENGVVVVHSYTPLPPFGSNPGPGGHPHTPKEAEANS